MGRRRRRKLQDQVTGVVTPEDRDEHHRPMRVSLVTDDETYLIHDDDLGLELLDYEWETVRVWGVIDRSFSKMPTLFVQRFEPAGASEGYDWDDDLGFDELSF